MTERRLQHKEPMPGATERWAYGAVTRSRRPYPWWLYLLAWLVGRRLITEQPDYARIFKLEVELGLVPAPEQTYWWSTFGMGSSVR